MVSILENFGNLINFCFGFSNFEKFGIGIDSTQVGISLTSGTKISLIVRFA